MGFVTVKAIQMQGNRCCNRSFILNKYLSYNIEKYIAFYLVGTLIVTDLFYLCRSQAHCIYFCCKSMFSLAFPLLFPCFTTWKYIRGGQRKERIKWKTDDEKYREQNRNRKKG